jgi:IS30 family transposase
LVSATPEGVPGERTSQWVKLAGMKVAKGSVGGLLTKAPTYALGAAEGKGKRISLEHRVKIEFGLQEGLSHREIARRTGFAPSTITREVGKYKVSIRGGSQSRYVAEVANQLSHQQRARPKTSKLNSNTDLRSTVVEMLNDKYSPEQVAGRLIIEFPDRSEMRVSHETIYQALYVQTAGALRHELTVEKALRSGRNTRKPKSKLPSRNQRPWLEGARIKDRPAEAADRAVPGHWEGDLIIGSNNSAMVTLTERRSRFELVGKLDARDSKTVVDKLTEMVQQLPSGLFRTITWDQGQEMAQHSRFKIATGCEVYFADPHSPWQRPSNENQNGLLRDFWPKGADLSLIPEEEVQKVQDLLNRRPRKVLNFYTPSEILVELVSSVALTS